MEPIKLRPIYKDYFTGGTWRLREQYGKTDTPYEITAESWELSCHPLGESIVDSGPHKGKSLSEYIKAADEDVVGTLGEKYDRFPLLIKFIDSDQDLVLGVHPPDAYAQEHENEMGKSEMWFYIDCEEGAIAHYGFNRDTSREEYLQKVADGTLMEIVGETEVHPGDAIMVNAGTIHGIGRGTLIAEIQQNSDATYSMYDYGRNTPGVRLNIERSAEVLDFRKAESIILPKPAPETWEGWRKYWVGECPFFVVYRLEVDPCASLETDQTSFHHLLFYRGSGEIRWEGGSFPIKQGDSVMVPANHGAYQITGDCKCLLSIVK